MARQHTTLHPRTRWLYRELEGNPARNSHEGRKARRRNRINRKAHQRRDN